MQPSELVEDVRRNSVSIERFLGIVRIGFISCLVIYHFVVSSQVGVRAFCLEPLMEQNDGAEVVARTIEGRFVDKEGNRVDGRQMGSWMEIRDLSTGKYDKVRVDELGFFRVEDLKAGTYRIWVRRHSEWDSCGIKPHSWKLELNPGESKKFVGTVHWMDHVCVVE